jgi:hypothetical protein
MAQRPQTEKIARSSPGDRRRLLALEIRTKKLGFAVLESPTRLLDWGMRSFGEEHPSFRVTVSDRIATLLAFHRPVAVVARLRKCQSPSANRRVRAILSAVREETKRHSIRFRVVNAQSVRDHFASSGPATKYDIARRLAAQFVELLWRLPKQRKPYQSESPAMLVFDALATGLASLEGGILSSPDL